MNGVLTGGLLGLLLALWLVPGAAPMKRRVLKRMPIKRGRDLGIAAGKMVIGKTKCALGSARRMVLRSAKH
jgi:hypothetical protein